MTNSVAGVVTWAFTTLALTSALSLAGWAWGAREGSLGKKGWVTKPVVVAARDLPAGTVLAETDLTAGSRPDQFVTSSLVGVGDLRSLRGQRLRVAAVAGDAIGELHLRVPHPLEHCVGDARRAAGWTGLDEPEDPDVKQFLERLSTAVEQARGTDGGVDAQ